MNHRDKFENRHEKFLKQMERYNRDAEKIAKKAEKHGLGAQAELVAGIARHHQNDRVNRSNGGVGVLTQVTRTLGIRAKNSSSIKGTNALTAWS